jgi:hypothetical protein
VFRLLATDDIHAKVSRVILKRLLPESYEIQVVHVRTESKLRRLIARERFDLVCIYLGNISWTEYQGESGPRLVSAYLSHKDASPDNDEWCLDILGHMVKTLASLRRDYGTPIIATQGMEWTKYFEGTGVPFFRQPISVPAFRETIVRLRAERGDAL